MKAHDADQFDRVVFALLDPFTVISAHFYSTKDAEMALLGHSKTSFNYMNLGKFRMLKTNESNLCYTKHKMQCLPAEYLFTETVATSTAPIYTTASASLGF